MGLETPCRVVREERERESWGEVGSWAQGPLHAGVSRRHLGRIIFPTHAALDMRKALVAMPCREHEDRA